MNAASDRSIEDANVGVNVMAVMLLGEAVGNEVEIVDTRTIKKRKVGSSKIGRSESVLQQCRSQTPLPHLDGP